MAKSENPLDIYRRQQRKKELKKNKNVRIQARDAKVAATRTVDEVKAEISLLERKRHRNGEKTRLDAAETKKIERLQKELRIVLAESGKRKALAEKAQLEYDKELLAAQKTVGGVQKLNESKYSVLERYASVYYDEQLNPFGAPAPGQPKLYYADEEGETTTMDATRAIVPAKHRKKFDLEREADDGLHWGGGTATHLVKKRRWDVQGDKNNSHEMMQHSANITIAPQQQFPLPPSSVPLPPPNLPYMVNSAFLSPPPLPPPMSQQIHNAVPPLPPPPPPPPPSPPPSKDKSQLPALPAPSKAVLRASKLSSGKKNAMADIWASQEEMDYEQTLGSDSMAMEGIVDQQQQLHLPRWKRNKSKNSKSRDDNTVVNDPCCPSAEGYGEYRNKEQIERQAKEVSMHQKQHVMQHFVASTTQQKRPAPSYNAQQPWYYRDNTSGAIQGPFSSEQMMGWRRFFPLSTPVRYGQSMEFVPLLTVDFMSSTVPPPSEVNVEVTEEGAVIGTKDVMPPLTAEDEPLKLAISEVEITQPSATADNSPEVDVSSPPSPGGEGDGEDKSDDKDKGCDQAGFNHNGSEVDACVPPPSYDEADGEIDSDEACGAEVDLCLPPPSDDDDEEGQSEICYPDVGEHLLPSNDVVPYPVDVEYPVEDDAYAYPNSNNTYAGTPPGEIAVVAPYPRVDDVVFGVTTDAQEEVRDLEVMSPVKEGKKKYDGDKAVVGLMPSHLQVKRIMPNQTKKPSLKNHDPQPGMTIAVVGRAATQQKYSVQDDYNKFMEEISELKSNKDLRS